VPQRCSRKSTASPVSEASRSGVPLPTRLTFTAAIQAAVHCPCAALPPSGLRLLSEHARGHGHPRAHQTDCREEAGSGSDRTCSTLDVAPITPPSLPMSTSGQSRTSASWLSAPRKAGQEARSFREAAAANEHQRKLANLGFAGFRQGKPGRKPGLSVKQLPPMSTSGSLRTSASQASAKESRAGSPVFP